MSHTEEKLDFKRILPIFVIVLVDLLGLTIIIPIMPLYAVAFGASAFMIGMLGTAYPAMQFIGAPLLGRLSDRYGRKPILLISQLGTLIGFLLMGLAGNLWMLFLARIVDGLSGANLATAQAAISDSTTEKTRTQGLGLIGAAFGLGFIIGPIIAFVSLALSGNNYRVPAFVAAGFSLLSILLTLFWFQETLPAEQRGKAGKKAPFTLAAMLDALRHPAVGLLLVLLFAQQIAFGGFEKFLALFTLNRLGMNASGNSIIFVFVGVIVVVVQGGLIGRWSRKYGDRKLVYAGLLVLAIGLSVFALTPRQPMPGYSRAALEREMRAGGNFASPITQTVTVELPPDDANGWVGLAWLLVAMLPVSVGGGILHPALNSLISRRVEKDQVGGILGISAAFLSAANAVAPLLMGALFQTLGSSAPFLFGGGLMALLLLVALRWLPPDSETLSPPEVTPSPVS